MGRARRPNLPGTPFHLTARVQWQKPLLAGLQAEVLRLIHEEAAYAGVRIVAYAVMSNHLHIVVFQGPDPLGWFMQRMLRRVALAVMRRHECEGHVFERRYFARPCHDPRYMRALIAYVHLNPVRAKICADPADFAWSSHRIFLGHAVSTPRGGALPDPASAESQACAPVFLATAESAVRLFAPCNGLSAEGCRSAYRAYLAWRVAADTANTGNVAAEPDDAELALEPDCLGGDMHWARDFAAAAIHVDRRRDQPGVARPDLSGIARRILREHAPEVSLGAIRGGGVTRPIVTARRAVIVHALAAGYRTVQIARYLNVAPSTVSLAGAALRRSVAPVA